MNYELIYEISLWVLNAFIIFDTLILLVEIIRIRRKLGSEYISLFGYRAEFSRFEWIFIVIFESIILISLITNTIDKGFMPLSISGPFVPFFIINNLRFWRRALAGHELLASAKGVIVIRKWKLCFGFHKFVQAALLSKFVIDTKKKKIQLNLILEKGKPVRLQLPQGKRSDLKNIISLLNKPIIEQS